VDNHNKHADSLSKGSCRSFFAYTAYYSRYHGDKPYILAAGTPSSPLLQAFLLQRGMIIPYAESYYEVIENRGGVHDFNPMDIQNYPNDSKRWADLTVELILREVTYKKPKLISLKGPAHAGFHIGYIYLDEYKILMHEEDKEQFCLLNYSRFSNNRSDLQATAERIDDAERVPCPKEYVEAVDRIVDEGEKLEEVAQSMELDPNLLLIYKEILEIYDEGECDCLV